MRSLFMVQILVIVLIAYGIYDEKSKDKELRETIDSYVTLQDITKQHIEILNYRMAKLDNYLYFNDQRRNCFSFLRRDMGYMLECLSESNHDYKIYKILSGLQYDNYVEVRE